MEQTHAHQLARASDFRAGENVRESNEVPTIDRFLSLVLVVASVVGDRGPAGKRLSRSRR